MGALYAMVVFSGMCSGGGQRRLSGVHSLPLPPLKEEAD